MVASASGVGVWLCPSALDGESAPFGAAVMASSGVCASLSLPFPVCPASGRYRACLPLDLVVRCSSACGAVFRVLATWGPLLVPCSFCTPFFYFCSPGLGLRVLASQCGLVFLLVGMGASTCGGFQWVSRSRSCLLRPVGPPRFKSLGCRTTWCYFLSHSPPDSN